MSKNRELRNEQEYLNARQYSLKQLSYRLLNKAQLQKKLFDQEISAETIDLLITELQEKGYVNDREWADGCLRQEVRKGRSIWHIMAKLRSKGLSKEEISEFFADLDPKELEIEAMKKLYRTKFPSLGREKFKAMLVKRGFDHDNINEFLNFI